jgi:hypothetical protein
MEHLRCGSLLPQVRFFKKIITDLPLAVNAALFFCRPTAARGHVIHARDSRG